MVQVRLSHMVICGCLAVLSACDAPPQESASAVPQERPAAESLSAGASSAPASAVNTFMAVPQDEAQHAAAIARLLKYPRPDALYTEQVKLLTAAYLQKYPASVEAGQQAMLCFIQAILLWPERFSDSDFDRAYEFCDYPKQAAMLGHSRLFKVELMLVDSRCSADEKNDALNKVHHIMMAQANKNESADTAAHAYYILAKNAAGAQRQEIIGRYLQHADCPGTPYRLRLLNLADFAPPMLLPYILDEAEVGIATADDLLPFLHILAADENVAAQLRQHPVLGPVLVAVLLEKLLDAPDSPQAALDSLAAELEQRAGAQQSLYAKLVLARYRVHTDNHESAVAIYRELKAHDAYMTPESELLYAEALAATADGVAEAEAVYRTLAQHSELKIASAALKNLLPILENQKRYKEAFDITESMLSIESNTDNRVALLFKRATLAELTGNINEAIAVYSILENNYSGDFAVALPACQKLMQLLTMRNFHAQTNTEKGTYSPSDKWYAWERGSNFVKRVRQSQKSEPLFTESQKLIFEDICKMVDSLGQDKNVISEERARVLKNR